MTVDKAFVRDCVERHRANLLDTSKRNTLVSFNHSERSRQHIRVIDELPDFLYGEIMNGKKLTFLALPEVEDDIPSDEKTLEFRQRLEQVKLTDEEYIKTVDSVDDDKEGALDEIKNIERALRNRIREELGLPAWVNPRSFTNAELAKNFNLNPSYEMPEPTLENQKDAKHHVDQFIQTLLRPEEMERKLSGLSSYIRSDIEESGVNTLYAAFGFLQWYESEHAEKACISPLLLVQLEMVKKQSPKGYLYTIQSTGEEPEVNLSVSERLKSDFGVELPAFDESDGPESYMEKVKALIDDAAVPKKNKWSVRRFITIGRFRFARLVMFHDLDEKKWPSNKAVSENKIIQELFTSSGGGMQGDYVDDYDIDTPEVEAAVPLLITSADASQHSALVDVMNGKNLAIKGPPGTGKSQTITNIIANALAKGKTVLFLAEKMAALNVVYERLSEAGLGPYCLELHSTKAKKSDVLKSLENRIKLRSKKENDADLKAGVNAFKHHKDYISEYLNIMNAPFGSRGLPVHNSLWAAQARKDKVKDLLPILSQVKLPYEHANMSQDACFSHVNDLKNLTKLQKDIHDDFDGDSHPWGFVSKAELNPFQQEEIRQLASKWLKNAKAVHHATQQINFDFNLGVDECSDGVAEFLSASNDLASMDISCLDIQIMQQLNSVETAEGFVAFLRDVTSYQQYASSNKVLNDFSLAVEKHDDIEKAAELTKRLDVECLSIVQIEEKVDQLKRAITLWQKVQKEFDMLGDAAKLSSEDVLCDVFVLLEALRLVAEIPREYLVFKTEALIDERNMQRLKNAETLQENIEETVAKYENLLELSLIGSVADMRMHAAILDEKSFFSFLDASYRRSKKFCRTISKNKKNIDLSWCACALRDLADAQEKRQMLDQDIQLASICGFAFDGAKTDFSALCALNAWGVDVRKLAIKGTAYSRQLRDWVLAADMDGLDALRALSDNQDLISLRAEMPWLIEILLADCYIGDVSSKIETLRDDLLQIVQELKPFMEDHDRPLVDMCSLLPTLKNAADIKSSVESFLDRTPLAGCGLNMDVSTIEPAGQFLDIAISQNVGKKLLSHCLAGDFFERWSCFVGARTDLANLFSALAGCELALDDMAGIRFSNHWGVDGLGAVSYGDLVSLLQKALDKEHSLAAWASFQTQKAHCNDNIKKDVIKLYDHEGMDYDTLPLAFEYMVFSAIAREIYNKNPALSSTKGIGLEQARARIKELDQEISELQRSSLCARLNRARPVPGYCGGSKRDWTEDSLLHNEINKKRQHIPIRSLVKRAGRSIQNIKPCFLMSPLSVAQYLEPGKIEFDLLVIDEASQMRPEDALGGVARAKQIVVVGDPQQLPPTSFFGPANNSNTDGGENFISEAIMDMALTSFRPSRTLSRHYRSQHESLIAFSNYHFYDKKLTLFPSPVKNPEELGVRLEYVGGIYTSNSNMLEVQAVVKAALDFMRKYPSRSLGIATMNQVQKDLIEIEMDRAFAENPHAANYRDKWQNTLESFFVKNLESVQGDERDAIFISTVFGPQKEGERPHQNFGPINKAGGYRRLNVLFTRAKKNMVVFTSLKPNDITVSEKSPQGVRAFKGFLTFASKGVVDDGIPTNREPDSDFEVWVKEKLESIGCEVHPQVGVAGYRIDLGIKHPHYPDGYLMGIECDGATYHSAKSARERDVIRQQVLEGLGWRIYRIWSTDWFANPDHEIEKVKRYIEGVLKEEACKSEVADRGEGESLDVCEDQPLLDAVVEHVGIDSDNTVELFDSVTYFVVKNNGESEKCSVQIVPSHGVLDSGMIAQHSAIGRALLGASVGDVVECALPFGEAMLEVVSVEK